MNKGRFENLIKKFISLFAIALLVCGCATTAQMTGSTPTLNSPGELKQRATSRATQYWQLVTTGKYKESYEYLTHTSRAAVPPDRYEQQLRGMRLKTAEVDKVECLPDNTCNIGLKMEVDILLPRVGFRTVPLEHREVWAFSNGDMYLIRK
ncbi:MAG: hypothetical protein ACRCWJ_12910 [Casimicrobium sp.]